jgi:tRNA threonylcarbamoyladenosine biosynthesis protein TsaE
MEHMSTEKTWQMHSLSSEDTEALGERIGARLRGGEVIELVGDIGAGKTTLTKGLDAALGIDDDVQSPTFTISRVYDSPRGVRLAHYDFYRLNEPGIMRAELNEAVRDQATVTVIEWAEVAADVLPADCLRMTMTATDEETRSVVLLAGGEKSRVLLEGAAQ